MVNVCRSCGLSTVVLPCSLPCRAFSPLRLLLPVVCLPFFAPLVLCGFAPPTSLPAVVSALASIAPKCGCFLSFAGCLFFPSRCFPVLRLSQMLRTVFTSALLSSAPLTRPLQRMRSVVLLSSDLFVFRFPFPGSPLSVSALFPLSVFHHSCRLLFFPALSRCLPPSILLLSLLSCVLRLASSVVFRLGNAFPRGYSFPRHLL